MSSEPLPDFTAILLPAGQHDPTSIRRAVLAGGYGDVWLRARPIASLGVVAVELFDAAGAPRADAALVAALSQGGRAAFIHRSAGAGQAIMHLFAEGREALPLWQGKPEELDDKASAALGQTVSAIAAADDSSRPHPAFAGTGTIALVRGRPLGVPTGTPLQLGSFGFHDRNPGAARKARPSAVTARSISRSSRKA